MHAIRNDHSSIRRFSGLLRPYTRQLLVAVAALVCLAGVNMTFPLFIKLLIDDIFPNDDRLLLCLTLLGLVLFYAARNVLYFHSKTTSVEVGENVSFNLRNALFERLQQMNLQFYRTTKPGQISSRVMDDSFVIQTFIQDQFPKLLLGVFMFLGLVASLYAVNWQLALASTVVLPLHLLVFRWFQRTMKDSSRAAQEQLSIVHGNLIEKFLGVEVVKGFTGEQRESEAFLMATDRSRVSQLRSKSYHVRQKIVGDLLVGIGTIALLGFGAYQVMGPPQMEGGTFFMFFGWVGMLYPTVLILMNGLAQLTKCTASIDRVYDMLETGEAEDETHGTVFKPIRGHIVFDSVCFGYGDGTPVLRNVKFEVKPGQVCAFVGPSGSGKSTLVGLVPRLLEPDLGRVFIDGLDVAKINLHYLREHIGIAFQECFLFNSSILENLQYANPNVTMPQIVEVARRTGAHRFITKLAHGYETVIGDAGVSLSRGEKQRINLTRAMLKNPKILILDEATGSIDVHSESQILPAILDFMRGKTTLMITHRPELLKHADKVVALDEGRVVYEGAPEGATASEGFGV